mgnify:CR=1 FL=1
MFSGVIDILALAIEKCWNCLFGIHQVERRARPSQQRQDRPHRLPRVGVALHAEAGADMVAPSDMMDGRVEAIRTALDEDGYENTALMSYAVKFASAYYGRFREAAGSAPSHGDRKSYQMDFRNRSEAVAEAKSDIEEGADIIMVKPGISYLDVLRDLKNQVHCPLAIYQVSGEYSMLKAAAKEGWLDHDKVMMEQLVSMKRAGADIIASYFAKDAIKLLS